MKWTYNNNNDDDNDSKNTDRETVVEVKQSIGVVILSGQWVATRWWWHLLKSTTEHKDLQTPQPENKRGVYWNWVWKQLKPLLITIINSFRGMIRNDDELAIILACYILLSLLRARSFQPAVWEAGRMVESGPPSKLPVSYGNPCPSGGRWSSFRVVISSQVHVKFIWRFLDGWR